MKKFTILCFSIAIFATGCEQNKETTITTDTGTESSSHSGNDRKEDRDAPKQDGGSDKMCFTQQKSGDSFELNLTKNGNNARGNLAYLFKEKDSNRGQISGTFNGDVLIADYTFNSEGVTSVREVAFQIKDGKATEGYGDMEEKNGKMVFKDPANIGFGTGIVMTKVDCK